MEHLKSPHDTHDVESNRVPYVCRYPWDDKPFIAFPRRCAKLNFLNTPNVGDLWMRPREIASASDITTSELQELYQRWLFFGLLRDLLADNFRPEQVIITTGSTAPYVDTSVLPFLLDDWVAQETPAPLRQMLIDHIMNCLDLASAALRVVSLDDSPYHSFDKKILDSIASVCEMVASAAILSSKDQQQKSNIYGRTMRIWRQFLSTEATRAKMRLLGWCPFEIRKIFDTETSFSTIYYFGKLRRGFSPSYHEACEPNLCRKRKIDDQEYESFRKHIPPCQGCDEFSVNLSELENFLFKGSFPVLGIKLNTDEQIETIETIPASKCQFYVAISHVWADGLGNPSKNSLYWCQVTRLAQLSRKLRTCVSERNAERDPSLHFTGPCARWAAKSGAAASSITGSHICQQPLRRPWLSPIDSRVYLWIDTLCCPARRSEAKTLALKRMNDTYAGAGAVLVLDNGMQDAKASSMDWFEMAARVVVSRWATRLWTLQESTFAADIWIQFQDKPIDLYDIWKTWPDGEHDSTGSFALKKILRREMLAIKLKEDVGYASMPLAEIGMAARNRATSKSIDEAYCLGSLLEINVSTILNEATQEMRMIDLWRRASEKYSIPQNVIFHSGSRLQTKGFRWAPLSLMDVPRDSTIFQVGFRTAKIIANGFQVSFPGFRFHGISRLGSLERAHELQNGTRLWIRIENSKWLCILFDSGPALISTALSWSEFVAIHSTSVACITFADQTESGRGPSSVPGVLGYLENPTSNQPLFRSAYLCSVIIVDETYCRILESATSIIEANISKEPFQSLRESALWETSDDESQLQRDQMWQRADSWFARQAEAAAQQIPNRTTQTTVNLKMIMRELFTGVNGKITEKYDSDHGWVVD